MLVCLYLAAVAISGFTILRGVEPFDEGLMLQAARRIAGGELPYRDFSWPYGPAQPFLLGGSFKAFGVSLLGWRLIRALVDAAVALVVYWVVRREATPRLALVAWLTAACAMAQPTSANPFPIALLLGLAAVAAATRAASPRRAVLAAGALTALAALWRLDFALYAAGGVSVALALRPAASAMLRARRVGLYLAVAGAGSLLLYAPLIVAAGPGHLFNALITDSLTDAEYWRLPFPLAYHGELRAWPPRALLEDGKDVLGFYVPLLAVAGLVLAAAAAPWRRGGASPQLSGFLVFGGGCLAYLLSRADEHHAPPLLITLSILLPLSLARTAPGRAAGSRVLDGPGLARLLMAGVLGLLLLSGLANRLSALVIAREYAPVRAGVADGVRAPLGEAASLSRLVQVVQGRTRPGEPIYVVSLRSDLVRINNPLIYVLTERNNVTRRDFALQTSEPAQRAVVGELRSAPPKVVVRWTDPVSVQREPNRRGRSSGSRVLDAYLAADYRLLERIGRYDVLVPRAP